LAGLLDTLSQTWPARMGRGILDAMKLPGDVYAGRTQPGTDDYYNRATDLAGLVMGGAFPMAQRGALGMAGGKLGLPMDEASRMARATELGFDTNTRWYHGSPTMKETDSFDFSHPARTDTGYLGNGAYMTPQKWVADQYARPLGGGLQGETLELLAKNGKYKDFVYDENYIKTLEDYARSVGVADSFNTPGWSKNMGDALRREGYDGARGMNTDGTVAEMVVYKPENVRSVNAAFDPAKKDSGNLLASIAALLGGAAPLAAGSLPIPGQQPPMLTQ
jgi:hypothetical protein